MKKLRKNASIDSILKAVSEKVILKREAYNLICIKGYMYYSCDINAAPFNINYRWDEQIVNIPKNKRGNLGDYAGEKVSIIVTNIARNGARIEFFIKPVSQYPYLYSF